MDKEKIVHICMAVFTDEMGYQENLLTKYHAKAGYDVTVITSKWKYAAVQGKIIEEPRAVYVNGDGCRIRRLSVKGRNKKLRRFSVLESLYEALCEESPDVIFAHGCQYRDVSTVVRYIKNHVGCRLYVDNHADFSNSGRNWLSKNVLHRIIWRYYARKIEPYTEKFYGVLPARVDFLRDIYGLPEAKCELLVMGADDDLVERAADMRHKADIRKKYKIGENDFLIITGGKIDQWKKQTILLQKAVKQIEQANVRLIIFGSVVEELKSQVLSLCDDKIQYVGWLSVEDTYDLIGAADLAVYPGRHSTLWEQTAGQAIPMIVKHWKGTHHINIGGNAEFLYEDSEAEIREKIEKLLTDKDEYIRRKNKALSAGRCFLYSDIARKSIGCERN